MDHSSLLEIGVLLHKLFLTIAGEGYGQFQRIAYSFSVEDEAASIFCVSDVGAGHKIRGSGRWLGASSLMSVGR